MKITKPYTRENVKELNNIFDVFIVGSDIVWGTNITGNDWTYFLDFADDSKTKIAFSSSIGTKWNSDVEKQILSNLNKFKSISVREELAQSWLREIGINADVTCDPTMLWDSSFWSRMVERPKTNEQPYVLVYMWTKDMRTVNHAKMYAKAHGLRVKCQQFYNPIPGVDNVKPVSLEQWISLIANANTVFTASYHGLLYSLYFHKNVYYYNRENKSRMESLGKKLGSSNREISGEFKEQPMIDYQHVDNVINEMRRKSLLVLKNRVSEI